MDRKRFVEKSFAYFLNIYYVAHELWSYLECVHFPSGSRTHQLLIYVSFGPVVIQIIKYEDSLLIVVKVLKDCRHQ